MRHSSNEHLHHCVASGNVMNDVVKRAVYRLIDGEWILEKDIIATEEPLSIDIENRNGVQRWVSILRTPGSDHDLVIGLLLSESVSAW